MLEATDLACLRGDRLLFRHLGFRLEAGEMLRITGTNGSGKTSLLRILCGLLPASAGEIRWQGQAIQRERETWHAALLHLGHAPSIAEQLTPAENLRFACAAAGLDISAHKCDEALEQIGLKRQLHLPCKLLSQGQRRRVGLARLFLAQARTVWILDEPFTALDVGAVNALVHTIAAHVAQGGMAIFTTHQDVPLAARSLDVEGFVA